MAKDTNKRKSAALGVNASSADSRLKTMLLFKLAGLLNLLDCYRCGGPIESIDQFTKDHKVAWLNSENPSELFFDLDNVAFSHRTCNSSAATGTAGLSWEAQGRR